MDFSDVTRLFKADLAKVEEAIKKNYETDVPLIPGISNYLMEGGGKRIRPLLVLICSNLCGRTTDSPVIKHACVIEYIHAATLLHDDVVDETTVRRGRETVNSKWGSDASILVGDFLISRSILLLAHDCDRKIIQAISQATKLLVEGGILEYIHARKLDITEDLYLDILHRKTASIISVSCRLGSLLAEADARQEESIVAFGNDFGMAFQLVDDAMDYEGDEDMLGKPPGTDFREGHVTLPLLHLYTHSDRALKKKIEGFVKNPNLTSKDLDFIVERMRETKSIDYTLDMARDRLERAKAHLIQVEFARPEYLSVLRTVADHVLERFSAIKS